jgi:hypothetical protein
MNKNLRFALFAFVVVGAISFVLNFIMTALGARTGPEEVVIAMGIGVLVVYVLSNLSGNRKVATADGGARAQALSFAVHDGQARIYLIRTGFVGKAVGMNISIDGAERAHLKSPQFTCIDVAPGAHTIDAALSGGAGAQSNPGATLLTVQPGEAVALLMTVKFGGMKNNIAVETVALDEAKRLVAGMKMVVPLDA